MRHKFLFSFREEDVCKHPLFFCYIFMDCVDFCPFKDYNIIKKDEREDRTMTNTTPFNEYEEFIYLNTAMDREQAREYARECWNKGINKYNAVKNYQVAKNM